jgi:dinuclear metal center YbgI/SA1388 family protein
MAKVKDVYGYLTKFAPVEMKMDFDNVGFLVGKANSRVTKILVSLDITEDVIAEAAEWGAELIVSHHPLFLALKRVTDDESSGRRIIQLLENSIAAICMHTNLDAAVGGVNDALAKAVGITQPELLTVDGYDPNGQPYCIGRWGILEAPMEMAAFLPYLKMALQTNGLRYYDAGRPVRRVAVVGGSGGGNLHYAVEKGCDTFITADIKYNVFLDAKELGINLIDADHFCTENVVIPFLQQRLAAEWPEISVRIARNHKQTAQFF